MESLLFICFNFISYAFLYYTLCVFNVSANAYNIGILLIFSFILYISSLALLHTKIDRKKYFIFSSILTILFSLIFFVFGKNILSLFNLSTGTTNFTIYLYKYLFMFSPLLSLFFTSLHKIFAQKKQLIFLIALKCFLPIMLGLIFMHFLEFYKFLWLLAIIDLSTTVFSVLFSIHKN